MNLVQLDIQQLRIKHILFKSKLRSVLYGGNYEEAFFTDQGPVGQWFIHVGMPRYSHIGLMQELYRVHQELNLLAKQLIALYKNSKIEEAHEGLRAIDQKSDRFQELMLHLDQQTV